MVTKTCTLVCACEGGVLGLQLCAEECHDVLVLDPPEALELLSEGVDDGHGRQGVLGRVELELLHRHHLS